MTGILPDGQSFASNNTNAIRLASCPIDSGVLSSKNSKPLLAPGAS